MNNDNEQIINGANPSIIWTHYMDFLCEYGKHMKSISTKRMRANSPITWSELDNINKEIHDKLDSLMTWSEKFNQDGNAQQDNSITNTNESFSRKGKIRLTESQLHNIIKECIMRIV